MLFVSDWCHNCLPHSSGSVYGRSSCILIITITSTNGIIDTFPSALARLNRLIPSHCRPWRHAPHNNEPQWSQNVNRLYECDMNLWGTFMLNRLSGTTSSAFLIPGHLVITWTRHRLCITHVHTFKNKFIILAVHDMTRIIIFSLMRQTLALVALRIEDTPEKENELHAIFNTVGIQSGKHERDSIIPNKFSAYWAKSWLSEIGRHELMTIHLMHFASHGNTAEFESMWVLFECGIF